MEMVARIIVSAAKTLFDDLYKSPQYLQQRANRIMDYLNFFRLAYNTYT